MFRPSRKLHPFKLFIIILYGSHASVEWSGLTATVRNGAIAKVMDVAIDRRKDYFRELERMGYVKELTFEWGTSTFTLVPPPRLGARSDAT